MSKYPKYGHCYLEANTYLRCTLSFILAHVLTEIIVSALLFYCVNHLRGRTIDCPIHCGGLVGFRVLTYNPKNKTKLTVLFFPGFFTSSTVIGKCFP